MKEPASKTLQCEKHKAYKGLKPDTKGCPDCEKLYRCVQRSINRRLDPNKPYQSTTTKDVRFGVVHMIAEWSCVMLYGHQPPYFWNTGNKAARHFKRELQKLFAWLRRDKESFAAVNKILYHSYAQYFKEMLAEREKNKPITPGRVVVREDHEDEEDEEPVGVEYFGYDPEQVERQALGKRYRGREKEETKKEGRQKD